MCVIVVLQLTFYVKYDIIFLQTCITQELEGGKNMGEKTTLLRKRLNEELKKQEIFFENQKKKCRKLRRDPYAWIEKIWDNIPTDKYEEIILYLVSIGSFKELEDFLNEVTRTKTLEHVSNGTLSRILEVEYPNHSKIFLDMSVERVKSYIAGEYASLKFILSIPSFEDRVNFVTLFSGKALENGIARELKLFAEFLELLCVKGDIEDAEEIFQNIAEISPAMIAKLLENCNKDVVCKIVEKMAPDKIYPVCCEIKAEKLFCVLEKCDYAIMSEKFPISLLSAKERQSVFSFLKEKMNVALFDKETIVLYLYPVVEREGKAYILQMLLKKEDRVFLYQTLAEDKKAEMLKIMLEIKMEEEVLYVLSEKEGDLDALELIIFNELSC